MVTRSQSKKRKQQLDKKINRNNQDELLIFYIYLFPQLIVFGGIVGIAWMLFLKWKLSSYDFQEV
tara:strand:- start:681 stop:875 length:195 start_codon:yes stop_codon:yes gene_type:complete